MHLPYVPAYLQPVSCLLKDYCLLYVADPGPVPDYLGDHAGDADPPNHCQMIQASCEERKSAGWQAQPRDPRCQQRVGRNQKQQQHLDWDSDVVKKMLSRSHGLGIQLGIVADGDCWLARRKRDALKKLVADLGLQRAEVPGVMKKYGASPAQAAAAVHLASRQLPLCRPADTCTDNWLAGLNHGKMDDQSSFCTNTDRTGLT